MSAVLVDVKWQDRILSSYGISRNGSVFMGGGRNADVVVPTLQPEARVEILRITDSGVFIKDTTKGDYYLKPGETARIKLSDNLLFLNVRQVSKPLKPKALPLFDMSSSETIGIVLAIAISAILGLYMNIYTPAPLLDEESTIDERISRAKVVFQRPNKTEAPKSSEGVPSKRSAPSTPSSTAQASAVKRNKPPGSLLTAFGTKGINETLNKTFSEGNSLINAAGSATGRAGNLKIGGSHGDLKETGTGRDGNTVTIGGLGTNGRNSGATGYRAGGFTKGGSVISVSGSEATFNPGMDREAIRRVIREHLREIRNCYEKELQRQPDLYGKLVISWDIEAGGRVTNAGIKDNSTGNAKIGECLVGALRGWKFPEPPANQIGRISYPFIFSSQ